MSILDDMGEVTALKKRIKRLEAALMWFAENPDGIDRPGDELFPCHAGICDKFKCARCGKAIEAWQVVKGE